MLSAGNLSAVSEGYASNSATAGLPPGRNRRASASSALGARNFDGGEMFHHGAGAISRRRNRVQASIGRRAKRIGKEGWLWAYW
jgi:hypothetical protein